MTKRQKPKEGGRSIQTGGGAYVEGSVHVEGGTFVGRDQITYAAGADANAIAEAFARLHEAIAQMPDGPDKEIAAQAAQGLEQEADKGDQAQESAVRRWLGFLAETAPDAWQVAVDTFTNPIKGLSTAFQLIAKKARESQAAQADA